MTSEESNVETVRRVYQLARENWKRGRAGEREWPDNPIWELFDPEAVLEEVAEFPDAAVYRGREGIARWWTGFFDVFEDVRWELREVIPVGDRVVARVHMWLRSKEGVDLEQEVTNVFTLRGRAITHVVGYRDWSRALAAVGLNEPDSSL
jgi:ketosteroid isomerase-like protein